MTKPRSRASSKTSRQAKLTANNLHLAEEYIERLRKRAEKQEEPMTEWHLNMAGVEVSQSIQCLSARESKTDANKRKKK